MYFPLPSFFGVSACIDHRGVTSRRGSREEFQGGSIAGWDSPITDFFLAPQHFPTPIFHIRVFRLSARIVPRFLVCVLPAILARALLID